MRSFANSDHRRERKDKVVHARFSATEIERIGQAAEAAGMTISGFLRSLVIEGAGVCPFFNDADRAILSLLLSDVKAVGVNLNQLARARNKGETARLEEERAVLDDVQRTLAIVQFELQSFAKRGARKRIATV